MSLDTVLQNANIDGLVQERRNSSALAMELRLSCTNQSIWYLYHFNSSDQNSNAIVNNISTWWAFYQNFESARSSLASYLCGVFLTHPVQNCLRRREISEAKTPVFYEVKNHGCWSHGDAKSQGISSHSIDLIIAGLGSRGSRNTGCVSVCK